MASEPPLSPTLAHYLSHTAENPPTFPNSTSSLELIGAAVDHGMVLFALRTGKMMIMADLEEGGEGSVLDLYRRPRGELTYLHRDDEVGTNPPGSLGFLSFTWSPAQQHPPSSPTSIS